MNFDPYSPPSERPAGRPASRAQVSTPNDLRWLWLDLVNLVAWIWMWAGFCYIVSESIEAAGGNPANKSSVYIVAAPISVWVLGAVGNLLIFGNNNRGFTLTKLRLILSYAGWTWLALQHLYLNIDPSSLVVVAIVVSCYAYYGRVWRLLSRIEQARKTKHCEPRQMT